VTFQTENGHFAFLSPLLGPRDGQRIRCSS